MKAGKLNVDNVNFLGFSLTAREQQRMSEIEDEFEYELSSDYDDDEDDDDKFVEDAESDDSSSL